MRNYRLEIEELILSSFLYQDLCNELDKCDYEDFILPYNHFKATRTNKLIAKAIYVLQEKKMPISDITVLNFIQEKTNVNEIEFLELLSKTNVTFSTMLKYLEHLKEIDKEESIKNKLGVI